MLLRDKMDRKQQNNKVLLQFITVSKKRIKNEKTCKGKVINPK
jgi:hypothetical protein